MNKPYFLPEYGLPNLFSTLATTVVGLKSIAAYRGGLEIDPYVSKQEAENGLSEVLSGP